MKILKFYSSLRYHTLPKTKYPFYMEIRCSAVDPKKMFCDCTLVVKTVKIKDIHFYEGI